MKKILLAGLILSCFFSCKKASDFLENKTTGITEEQVFSDSILTTQFLSRMYSDLGFSFLKGRWSTHGNTEQATDDAEYNFSGTAQAAVVLYNGMISPTIYNSVTILRDFWNVPYANIRRANLLIAKLPGTPLSPAMQSRFKGEARFLRAYYYT